MSRTRHTIGSTAVWRHRREAMEQFGEWPDCPYCEDPFWYADGVVDHINPASNGGANSDRNLLLVCPECNKSKAAKSLFRWGLVKGLCIESLAVRLWKQDKMLPDDMGDYLGVDCLAADENPF